MPAVAVLFAPGFGVALYLATGVIGPTLVAIGLAAVALAITVRVAARAADPSAGVTGAAHDGILGWLVEPSALPAMLMTAMFMAADALFTVFPPVYLAIAGDPVELLALYYPAYGLVMAVSHFGAGHVSDRLGRGFTIRIGCVLGAIGLAVALLGEGIVFFGMGAGIYAVATALVSPALNALSIDRAPAHRLGSAMATYSIGYQLAIGGGSVVWGQLITAAGFDAAFGAAILLVLLTLTASYRYGGGTGRASPPLVGSVDHRGT
jgi:predicted MFS family arabinose efflux permease